MTRSLSPEALLALGILQARVGRSLSPEQVAEALQTDRLERAFETADKAIQVNLWLDPELLADQEWSAELERQLTESWQRCSNQLDLRRGDETIELLVTSPRRVRALDDLLVRLRRAAPPWALVTPVTLRESSRRSLGPGRGRGYSSPSRDSRTPPRSRTLGRQAESSPATPTGRHLQTQVFSREEAGLVQRTRSFRPGRTHLLRARIGRSDRDWLAVDQAFPEHLLPPDRESTTLTVTLHAPEFLPAPLSRALVLPRGSDSTVADFELPVPEAATAVEALLIVYHGNSPLQAAKLKGPVSEAHLDPAAPGIEIELGEASSVDLAHHGERDFTVFKQGDQLTLRWGQGDRSRDLSLVLGGLQLLVAGLRDRLFAAGSAVDALETGLDRGRGLELLRALAAQGEFLRRQLVVAIEAEIEDFNEKELQSARQIHAWSASAPDGFPVEFLYDLPPPAEDAELCPGFLAAPPGAEACSNCAASQNPKFVCPYGFWGLNRFIERQVRPWTRPDRTAPESSADQPAIAPVEDLIFAASDEVDRSRDGAIAATVAELQRITGEHVRSAKTWEQWKDLVLSHPTALLVALPHNVPTATGFPALEIAASDRLPLNLLGPQHVMPKGGRSNPVFLLLGCRTAAGEIAFHDFVATLRRSGAAIVVATLAEVIGHQAAATAQKLVELIWQRRRDNGPPFGELMRQLRVEMVKAGNPVGLALVAFGDADWRLAPPETR